MTTYKMTVRYAAGHDQEHPGLRADQVEMAVGAFLRDLIDLEGQGIRKLAVEVEDANEA